MSLNWDDLRIFLAVAREGNLSAAARSLLAGLMLLVGGRSIVVRRGTRNQRG